MRVIQIITILLSVIILSGFRPAKEAAVTRTGDPCLTQNYPQEIRESKKNKKSRADEQVTSNEGMLIEAKKEALIGNTEGAVAMFKRYVERYPKDPVGYYELAQLEVKRKNFMDALIHVKQASDLDPGNIWYMLLLSELYQSSSQYEEAIKLMDKIIQKDPDNLDYYYQIASMNLALNKYQEAIKVYNLIEEKAGVSEEISIQKNKIYLHLNNITKAEAELQKLITSFPGESRYYSILAEFYMSNNMPDKAIEVYKKITEIDPDNAYIHISLADYYRKTGNKEKAFEELKLGFSNPNLDIDAKVSILLTFYSLNQLYNDLRGEAFELSKILVETHPLNPKSHSIYGDLLLQDKKYPEARESFLKVMALDSSKYVIWEEILRLDVQLEEYQHLIKFSQQAIELFPEQPLPYLFAGIGNYQLKKFEEGVNALNSGIKLVVGNDELLAQFYMYLGDTYHALKNDKEAYNAYDRSLQLKETNPYVLNNYAYYLSLGGEALDKAEQMARKAVNLEPDNSSFQDTYGWIMFKLGKYQEAREWIGKALEEKESITGEVLEHYGDVLFKLGDPDQAMEYWIKAKKKGEGSDLLDKKISERSLFE